MKQLTIRLNDPEIEQRILKLAKEEGLSLNQAAIRLISKGAGIPGSQSDTDKIGDSLDDLAGTWTGAEEKAFLKAIEVFEKLDAELWR